MDMGMGMGRRQQLRQRMRRARVMVGVLARAAALSVEDLYALPPPDQGGQGILGRGRFAEVKEAWRRHPPQVTTQAGGGGGGPGGGGGGPPPPRQNHCALKIVDKNAFWQRVIDGKERRDTLVREIQTQATLTRLGQERARERAGWQCPVVGLYCVFETMDHVVLETELMSRVDLFDNLSKACVLDEATAARIVVNMVEALLFCHENGIAHRDVKLSNFIFPLPSAVGLEPVKLADFGMAGFVDSNGMLRGRCGTPGYVAPEILHASVNEPYPNTVDAFSVGVIAYTLLCGYEPFYGNSDRQLVEANKSAAFEFHLPEWGPISDSAKDLVRQLLEKSPSQRLPLAHTLSHPWLAPHCSPTHRGQAPSSHWGGHVGGRNRYPAPCPAAMGPPDKCSPNVAGAEGGGGGGGKPERPPPCMLC